MSYIKKWIDNIITSDLVYKLDIKNINEIPKIKKATLFINFTPATTSSYDIICGLSILKFISNEKPIVIRSDSSIPGSRLKKGTIIGCKCTLRKSTLYDFLDVLIFLILPRIKNLNFIKADLDGNCTIVFDDSVLFSQFFNKDFDFNNNLKITITLFIKSKNFIHSKAFLNSLQIPI